MQVIEWDNFLKQGLPLENSFTAMSIGFFDGVHKGHKALFDRVVSQASAKDAGLPVIITFRKKKNSHDIYSFKQKINLFKDYGIAITVVADLSESFMSMSGKEFLRILKEKGNMWFLAIGSNFRCGYNQDTDAQTVKKINNESGIKTEIIDVLTEQGLPISSSRIRQAIINGNLKEASAMLVRPYVLDMNI